MSNSAKNPPIPESVPSTTFKVAIGLLVIFFLLQVLAVAWHFLPKLLENAKKSAEKDTIVVVAPVATPAQAPVLEKPIPATPTPTPSEIEEEKSQQITKLVAESDKAYRIGDYDLAISSIKDADKLLPNDPGILLRTGRIYEKSGNISEAASVYQKVLSIPSLPRDIRAQTERKISLLNLPTPTPTPTTLAGESGSDMRDESGLQPGAILGIVDTRLSDGPNGSKTLRISIKSRPDRKIDPRQMTVHVFFYEKDKLGEITPTESPVTTEWLSPPINWADNEPELLNAIYNPPNPNARSKEIPSFAGYIVGIYYNNEIQDTRADPGSLAQQNPLPLYLKTQTP
jgi:hypothetical protein